MFKNARNNYKIIIIIIIIIICAFTIARYKIFYFIDDSML